MKTKNLFNRLNATFASVLLVAVIFCGCENEQPKKLERKCFLSVNNGSGWSFGTSTVECDSFQMQGTKKAFVWVDGVKMQIEAENVIYPHVR